MQKTSEHQIKSERFWRMFLNLEPRLFRQLKVDSPEWRSLLGELKRIDPRLSFEVSIDDTKPREFQLTAQGCREAFEVVRLLVNCAPHSARWKFIELKPAQGLGYSTCYNGITVNLQHCQAELLKRRDNPEILGLRIAVPGLKKSDFLDTKNAVLIAVDTAFGERLVADTFTEVMIAPVRDPCEMEDYVGMSRLPLQVRQYLEAWQNIPRAKDLIERWARIPVKK